MDSLTTMEKVLETTMRVVDGIEPSQLGNPTPCSEWNVRDVLNHMTSGAEMVAISLNEGGISPERFGELMTEDHLGTDYKGAVHGAFARAGVALQAPGALDKMLTMPFGTMPGSAVLDTGIFDVATHAWDLARGTGQRTDFDPEVLASAIELARKLIPDLRAMGLYGPEVTVADDTPMQDRLAALAGRTP
jgi:uncharacterized protein (TIGR03086 family)